MSVVPIFTSDPYDCSIWLVLGDSALIVDSGTGRHTDEVLKQIVRSLDGRKVSAVVLTHCHIDHVGGAAELSDRFSCPVYIGHGDSNAVRSADSDETVSGLFGISFAPLDVVELQEGFIFDLGVHRLRVIDTPGHTRGGICLYDEVTGSLFSGDTLFQNGFGRTDFPGGSMGDILESLRKLRNVNITTLYPGHGPCCSDGTDSLEQALHMVGYE